MMSSKVAREKGYIGDTRTQLRHGYGIYKYSNRFFRYEGEWKEGKKHGHGKLVMADGSFYEGEFINGEIEGHGFRKWASSGNTYSGQFCNGELNGCGVMTYGTGAVYEGEFQNNRKEGRGVMKFPDGSIYEGLFHDNVRHGEGSLTFPNGDCYIGDWVQDKRQGSGELKFHDGSLYDGQWRNDYYNGAGTFIHCSGMTYDGMWINGRPAVEAAKIVLTNPECQEITQDANFTITVEIQTEDDELVTDEEGRELHISAGFRHQVPNQGSPLLDLIEDMEETPVSTPYYDVINYPITEYSFMEERLKLMDDFGLMVPPSTGYSEAGTSPNPSAAPSIRGESPSRLEESIVNLETDKTEAPPKENTSPQEASSKPTIEETVEPEGIDVVTRSIDPPQEISNDVGEGNTEAEVKGQGEERDMSESPVPPPVSDKRSQSGKVEFENLILPGVPPTGETLPRCPPCNSLPTSAKSTKGKARGGKSRGGKVYLHSSFMFFPFTF
ncbi:putative MORN repeat-containing protein 1 isoform X6 [Apostichopus japonicus]|uniref:Putative MORN repeat-containing protein 1 isoform X6 n=1 Tax=Stichopus japonicus TaxID=307972 RepID=A0A2G8LDB1_STIJA|nr:putative MORN repeat-containing protein 1 isoform X6 [Apostichopus japonicus]